MRYVELSPSAALTPYVKCFWVLEADEAMATSRDHEGAASRTPKEPAIDRVYPDGCAELIFHRGDCFEIGVADGVFARQPAATVFGQLERHIVLLRPTRLGTVGVRFQHAGLAPLLGVPAGELTGASFALQEVAGHWGAELEDRVLSAETLQEAVRGLERHLLARVPSTAAEDASVAAAIDEIVTHGGRLRVDDVARSVGISVRHLERRFRDRVGLTPKRLAGILRLQRALACLGSNEPPPLVDVAYRCGYFDQPHFIRDFGRFTGMSPSQFLRGERGMDRFFFSP